MKPFIEVPEKFVHTLPDGSTFTINNNVRRSAGLPPVASWPDGHIWIFTKGQPDLGQFMPGLDMCRAELAQARAHAVSLGVQL